MAASPEVGLLGIYGAVIGAGIFGVVVAPFISRLLPLFPPVVTGTIILVTGISLMRVGINWAGGGLPTITRIVDGTPASLPNSVFGQLTGLGPVEARETAATSAAAEEHVWYPQPGKDV